MSDPVLECVPNVSEGRSSEVLERLRRAVRPRPGRPGSRLLDISSDRDHDRTVITLAGTPDGLIATLLDLFEVALAEIDLTARTGSGTPGVHPCMGAIDVVPFVPLGGAPMALAVTAAERLGREVAERFGLPVYLYEEAARREARRNLAAVRSGGFEGLAGRCADGTDPLGIPDLGPARPHPTAGAVAIGARDFLIAFNVVLASDDLEAARAVARAVRESNPSGTGLPAVKALGIRLASRGRVQVSMNLTDFRRTSPLDAVRAVRREAEERGVGIEECELVGLMPEAAAEASRAGADLLTGVDLGRTIERRLAETGLG